MKYSVNANENVVYNMADSIQCLCQIANAFNDKKRKFLIFLENGFIYY